MRDSYNLYSQNSSTKTNQKMAFPFLAVGGLLGSLLGGIGNRRAQRRRDDRTFQQNQQMSALEHSRNLEQWNRQNDYNSPVNTMGRLEKAGLNPNLVYGSGQATTPASTLASYNAPTKTPTPLPPIGIPEALGQFMQLKQQQAQLKNTEAVTKNIEEQSGIASLKKNAMAQAFKKAGIEIKYLPENLRYDLWTKQYGIDMLHQKRNVAREEYKYRNNPANEYWKNRKKQDYKKGKLSPVEEIMDELFEQYPELKSRTKGSINKIMRYLLSI